MGTIYVRGAAEVQPLAPSHHPIAVNFCAQANLARHGSCPGDLKKSIQDLPGLCFFPVFFSWPLLRYPPKKSHSLSLVRSHNGLRKLQVPGPDTASGRKPHFSTIPVLGRCEIEFFAAAQCACPDTAAATEFQQHEFEEDLGNWKLDWRVVPGYWRLRENIQGVLQGC